MLFFTLLLGNITGLMYNHADCTNTTTQTSSSIEKEDMTFTQKLAWMLVNERKDSTSPMGNVTPKIIQDISWTF